MRPALLLLLLTPILQAQSLALSFDDGPRLEQQVVLDAAGTNEAILAALKAAKVQSVLFVCGRTCMDKAEGRALVKAWGDAGHRLANHSFAHGSLNVKDATVDGFEADFLKNEALINSGIGLGALYLMNRNLHHR